MISKERLNDLVVEIRVYIETERDVFKKINEIYDDKFIRSSVEAISILDFLNELFNKLLQFFEKHPSLKQIFDKDVIGLKELISRDSILEMCFLDFRIIPENESTNYCDDDGNLNPKQLLEAQEFFNDWMSSHEGQHIAARDILQNEFSLELDLKYLGCACSTCVSGYYSNIRSYSISEAEDIIDSFKDSVLGNENVTIKQASNLFVDMKYEMDNTLIKARKKLKRSAANRLNSHIKGIMKEVLSYPSELALQYSKIIKQICEDKLKADGLRRDLVDDDEFYRFFDQLGINIWKNEKYIEQEMRRFIKVILAYKRKDISATILKDYLGEFWIHSSARRMNRKIIYHMGPTNSGKTYSAVNRLCEAKSGCYLAPLRLLAAELYDTMNNKGVATTLLTGEEIIEVEGASHYSSTIEMAKLSETFECCVIDEIQMIADSHRGWAWTRAFVNMCAPEIHICGDDSTLEMVEKVIELTGDSLEVINYKRMTDLKVETKPIVMGDLDKGDAVIVFSRRNALKYKADLEQLGYKVSVVYGRLSPEVRREQARKFDQGETDIIVSTDAIAMGMNLPIKRIVYTVLSKFINSKEHPLNDSELKQISGRAGRYKRFPTGYVTCLAKEKDGISKISRAINCRLPQKDLVMVGPDLDIFSKVNNALEKNSLPLLQLSEFLRLFNTMKFKKPFYCVNLSDMIEITEMVEEIDRNNSLLTSETFGFACAPVNLGLVEHVQFFVHILSNFVNSRPL